MKCIIVGILKRSISDLLKFFRNIKKKLLIITEHYIRNWKVY